MKNDILYFIAQTKYNIKNAHALKKSFWIGVWSMVLNNTAFFVMWIFFMKSTGPINGWTIMDVYGMLGVGMTCYGITHAFFFGLRELPDLVVRGMFDNVLLAPVNSFLKLSGSAFMVTAYGDLLLGSTVAITYGIYSNFNAYSWLLFIFSILLGCVVFICFRLICSLVAFFVHDAEIISTNVMEIFLRPGLYPGAIFPDKLKIVFMTIIPSLIASAVPIDAVKFKSAPFILLALASTAVWVFLTAFLYSISVKRYESGNFLR